MWRHLVSATVGAWLTAAPAWLGGSAPEAMRHDWIVGPIIFAVGIVAASEVTRSVRWVNVAAGLLLLAAPAIVALPLVAACSDGLSGGLVVVLSAWRSPPASRTGGGWRGIFAR